MTSVASFTDGDRIAIGLEEGLYVIEVTRDGECVALGPSALCRRQGSAVVCCRIGGTKYSSACRGPFEGGHDYLH